MIRYIESSDNDNLIFVNLSGNEKKYLSAVSNFEEKYYEYFLNSRKIEKTNDGDYIVITDNIRCSTIQSLIKYTKQSILNPTKDINKLFDDSEYSEFKEYEGQFKYEYNGESWLLQNGNIFFIEMNPELLAIKSKYNLYPTEFERLIKYILMERFNYDNITLIGRFTENNIYNMKITNENLANNKSVSQLKRLRKVMDADIGDISDYGKGANKGSQENILDTHIDTFEEYVKKNNGQPWIIHPFHKEEAKKKSK